MVLNNAKFAVNFMTALLYGSSLMTSMPPPAYDATMGRITSIDADAPARNVRNWPAPHNEQHTHVNVCDEHVCVSV